MTRNEVAALLAMLNPLPLANKPKCNTPEDARTVQESYYRLLAPYDKDVVLEAVKIHMQRLPYYPTPAHIIGNIQRAENLLAYNRNMRTTAAIVPERAEMPRGDAQALATLNMITSLFDNYDAANRACKCSHPNPCPIDYFKGYRMKDNCAACPAHTKLLDGGATNDRD